MKARLSKELEKQDPEELLRLIREMARRFPICNLYLNMEFGMDAEAIISKYQKQLEKEYFPARGRGKARVTKTNRILKEFDKLAAFQEETAEMRWFQLQLAARYLVTYRYQHEPFIAHFLKQWEYFSRLVHRERIVETFEERVKALLEKTGSSSSIAKTLRDIWERAGDDDGLPEPEED